MNKRATTASILASIALLVGGWQLGANTLATPVSSTSTRSGIPSGTTGTSTSGTNSNTVALNTGLTDGTYTGVTAPTRFGNVQVQVTVSHRQITEVTAVQLTDRDQRSVQISNRAAPLLRQEVISSQSANVSNVSGATYTTDGYLTSVQSAIDQARS